MIKIVVDCFGGDRSPNCNVEGAVRRRKGLFVRLEHAQPCCALLACELGARRRGSSPSQLARTRLCACRTARLHQLRPAQGQEQCGGRTAGARRTRSERLPLTAGHFLPARFGIHCRLDSAGRKDRLFCKASAYRIARGQHYRGALHRKGHRRRLLYDN